MRDKTLPSLCTLPRCRMERNKLNPESVELAERVHELPQAAREAVQVVGNLLEEISESPDGERQRQHRMGDHDRQRPRMG